MIMDTNDPNYEEWPEGIQAAEDQETIPEISFHAITGTTHPQTRR